MIDRNSRGTIAAVYAAGTVLLVLDLWLIPVRAVSWPLAALVVWFCIWQTAFFKVPVRKCAGSGRDVSAVADGKIVILEKVFEPEYMKQDCIQVSIYMNFFDVHANFWPVSGRVEYYRYYPGKHLLAFKPKASEDNEHTCTGVLADCGGRLLFKQIAGGFARRIVCHAKPGLPIEAGGQCGIIKFGSRIDIFLPLDADVKVTLGEYVRAGETLIATLAPAPSSDSPEK